MQAREVALGCNQHRGAKSHNKADQFEWAWKPACEKTGHQHDEDDARALKYGGCPRVRVADGDDVGHLAAVEAADAEQREPPQRFRVGADLAERTAIADGDDGQEQRGRAQHAHHRDEQARDGIVRQEVLRAGARKPPQRSAHERGHDADGSSVQLTISISAECIKQPG